MYKIGGGGGAMYKIWKIQYHREKQRTLRLDTNLAQKFVQSTSMLYFSMISTNLVLLQS